MEQRAVDAVQ